MCITAVVVTAISTAVSMVGQYVAQQAQADSAKAAAEMNAQAAENQAAIERQNAQNEIAKGVAEREQQQRKAARAMGDMRANMAAGGFEIDSGSNLSLLAESAGEHQYDSAVIDSNAQQAAWQHEVAAINATNNQSLYNWQAANVNSGKGAAILGMTGTLLGGIGKGIGQYNEWQKGLQSPATTGIKLSGRPTLPTDPKSALWGKK